LVDKKSGIDWERLAPDFKVEKITPKQFREQAEKMQDALMKQILRLSKEIEDLRKKIKIDYPQDSTIK
ncbi:MAG: hypothetical protein U9N06_03420, partial [candidate division WOR-3 bacterium]|nr:hypothetical protein [candidate division WOR-3 bacterium]